MHEADLQGIFEKIPITMAMGLKVLAVTCEKSQIFCPLAPNINHQHTVFGGSLSSAHFLSCYVWLYSFLNQKKIEGHIVVKESRMEFLKPVDKDFIVTCMAPSQKEQDHFLSTLTRKAKAGLPLHSQVTSDQGLLTSMTAVFVAFKARP